MTSWLLCGKLGLSLFRGLKLRTVRAFAAEYILLIIPSSMVGFFMFHIIQKKFTALMYKNRQNYYYFYSASLTNYVKCDILLQIVFDNYCAEYEF